MSPVVRRCEVTDETFPHRGPAKHYTLRHVEPPVIEAIAAAIHPAALPRVVTSTGADLCRGYAERLGAGSAVAL